MSWALDIHVENLDQKNFPNGDVTVYLRKILEEDKRVKLSFSPWQEDIWKEKNPEFFELAEEVVSINGYGQQGLNHRCIRKHKYVDPWHEFKCLWSMKPISKNDQIEIIEAGSDKLLKVFGKRPEVLVPPNHMFDLTTVNLAAARNYSFFTDQAVLKIGPYKSESGKMIVVPEGNLARGELAGRRAVYIHYDQIMDNPNNFELVLKDNVSMESLVPKEVSNLRIHQNDFFKYARKAARDAMNQ